ncbi:hypothetical protein RJ640_018077 [Escallonia rubra]|uniref:Uncharacterized protein n=1 Tax=Escallonia rubra TaxID=112253 RepID=A0AA88RQN8_9ASTE|nr:hypothetical protein RJ640_018077 [Escallonia rubra]
MYLVPSLGFLPFESVRLQFHGLQTKRANAATMEFQNHSREISPQRKLGRRKIDIKRIESTNCPVIDDDACYSSQVEGDTFNRTILSTDTFIKSIN